MTPAFRSPKRIAIRPEKGATSEKTKGLAMINQPMCEVENPRPISSNCGTIMNPPMYAKFVSA